MKLAIAMSLLGLGRANPMKLVQRPTASPPTTAAPSGPQIERGISDTLHDDMQFLQESVQSAQSQQGRLLNHYNSIYDNNNPVAYVHQHHIDGKIKFNNPGKDFSDLSTVTKVGSKTTCVKYCEQVVGLVFLTRDPTYGVLGEALKEMSDEERNDVISAKNLWLKKQDAERFNGLFNTCRTPCQTAYRQPKAVDGQWEMKFAEKYVEFLNYLETI